MIIQLHDNNLHKRFAPLSLTRPIGNLRVGLFTNDERWTKFLPEVTISYATEAYLQGKFPIAKGECVEVNAQVIPNEELVAAVVSLGENEALYLNELWIATNGNGSTKVKYIGQEPIILEQRWHLYQKNAEILEQDFELVTRGRISQPLNTSNTLIGDKKRIFLEEGAIVNASILNTTSGPIYVGKEAEIMEGSIVRGGLAMQEHSALKLGTKVYGAVTLGPHCKVGGEVNNVVFQAYSNKGHDGFLGNALIGEWCNLGADTNTSNLKNNYGNVASYSYETNQEEKTDIQFMGVCMGDHSKCGINTMFNTGTVVGVSSNIYGAGFPEKFCNSFQWGGPEGMVPFRFDKAVEYANNMMVRRGLQLSVDEINILKKIQEESH
jgi:UDP-N-acetylglucosamine diphosphorylase/glucosamine-1-phosphate N-acetyltransferase